jgi:hypothetical protein
VNNWKTTYSWRLSIIIQAGLELPILIILLLFIDHNDLDILQISQEKVGENREKDEIKQNSFQKLSVYSINFFFI